MHSLREAFNRIRSFFRNDSLDRELNQEMASHLEMAVEENIRRGMSAEEAWRQAMVRFGGAQQSLELHRESRGLPWLDVLTQDLRFTFRTLRRDYGFTMIAVLILALGIATNITVFSVVNTILLRPCHFPSRRISCESWKRMSSTANPAERIQPMRLKTSNNRTTLFSPSAAISHSVRPIISNSFELPKRYPLRACLSPKACSKR